MHEISQAIEEDGEFLVICPDCSFAFDLVALDDAMRNGGNVEELVQQWRHSVANRAISERQ